MNKQPTTVKAHFLRSAFFLLLLLSVCGIPFALAHREVSEKSSVPQDCMAGPWQEVATMPTDLYGPGCASDGTFVYCGGGYSFSSGNTLAVFNRYDPVANTWTSLPDMPQSAIMPVGVYYPTTNKIYIFGGEDAATGTNYSITRIYDIASNTWSTGANMPDVRSFSAGGYSPDNGMIYIISGYNTGFVTDAQPNTWQYNPATNTWTDLTGTVPFPHPAGGMAFGVINGKLYIAGGRDANNTIINLNWEFDPTIPVYNAKADEPSSYQNNVPGSGVALNALWVFGGGNPFARSDASKSVSTAAFSSAVNKGALVNEKNPLVPFTDNQTRFYDPSADTWGSAPNMNEFRSFPGGAAIGTLLVAAGGFSGFGSLASAEKDDVCATGGTPTPTPTVTPTPTATPTPTPGQIVLRANGQRLGPHRKAVQLRWIGANPPRVDIFRNGIRIARVPTNPGTYTDVLTAPGQYTYKVCDAGSMNCSNEVTVRGP